MTFIFLSLRFKRIFLIYTTSLMQETWTWHSVLIFLHELRFSLSLTFDNVSLWKRIFMHRFFDRLIKFKLLKPSKAFWLIILILFSSSQTCLRFKLLLNKFRLISSILLCFSESDFKFLRFAKILSSRYRSLFLCKMRFSSFVKCLNAPGLMYSMWLWLRTRYFKFIKSSNVSRPTNSISVSGMLNSSKLLRFLKLLGISNFIGQSLISMPLNVGKLCAMLAGKYLTNGWCLIVINFSEALLNLENDTSEFPIPWALSEQVGNVKLAPWSELNMYQSTSRGSHMSASLFTVYPTTIWHVTVKINQLDNFCAL